MGCGFMQLNTVVDPDFLYRDFRYQTGISLGLREHFQALIDTLRTAGEITATSFVIDVENNDGSLLAYAAGHGARVLGIDLAEKIAEAATRRGIPTVPMFFTERTAESLPPSMAGRTLGFLTILLQTSMISMTYLPDFGRYLRLMDC